MKRAAEVERDSPVIRASLQDLIHAHVSGFSAAFLVSAVLGLAGAAVMLALVRTGTGRVLAQRAPSRAPR